MAKHKNPYLVLPPRLPNSTLEILGDLWGLDKKAHRKLMRKSEKAHRKIQENLYKEIRRIHKKFK